MEVYDLLCEYANYEKYNIDSYPPLEEGCFPLNKMLLIMGKYELPLLYDIKRVELIPNINYYPERYDAFQICHIEKKDNEPTYCSLKSFDNNLVDIYGILNPFPFCCYYYSEISLVSDKPTVIYIKYIMLSKKHLEKLKNLKGILEDYYAVFQNGMVVSIR